MTHAPKTREKPQQIADELRQLIIVGELDEGDSLGHEPDLIERFGVSRPSLREALRILEAEGLITVVRGVRSQQRLVELIESGDADGAEEHWRTHMGVVGKVMLGQKAKTVVDLLDHL